MTEEAVWILVGVLVPPITSLLVRPTTPTWIKRATPIALSLVIALLLTALNGGLTRPSDWGQLLALAAGVMGLAQTVFASLPDQLRTLTRVTSPDHPNYGTDPHPIDDAEPTSGPGDWEQHE